MNDREAIGVDRPLSLLGNEVVHDAQEAGGQKEAHGIVAVPPLGQGVLHTGIDDIALGAGPADRQRQIVDNVQQGDGQDKAQVEPVGDIDVGLLALDQRPQENHQVNHPHQSQPNINIPLRLGVLFALGDAVDIAPAGHQQKQLIPEKNKQRAFFAKKKLGATGSLHHIERRGDQGATAEPENYPGGMPAETQ